jgi:hypothetical protein
MSKAADLVKGLNAEKPFDPEKLVTLFESDPIQMSKPRDGALSVQVYSYDGGPVRIALYKVFYSTTYNSPRTMKVCPPLSGEQSVCLANSLMEAVAFVKNRK